MDLMANFVILWKSVLEYLSRNMLLSYILVMSCVTFVLFGIDKYKACRHRWRIPETTLLGLSLAGGAFGGILAMWLFCHKARKPYFKWGLPAMLLMQLVVLWEWQWK